MCGFGGAFQRTHAPLPSSTTPTRPILSPSSPWVHAAVSPCSKCPAGTHVRSCALGGGQPDALALKELLVLPHPEYGVVRAVLVGPRVRDLQGVGGGDLVCVSSATRGMGLRTPTVQPTQWAHSICRPCHLPPPYTPSTSGSGGHLYLPRQGAHTRSTVSHLLMPATHGGLRQRRRPSAVQRDNSTRFPGDGALSGFSWNSERRQRHSTHPPAPRGSAGRAATKAQPNARVAGPTCCHGVTLVPSLGGAAGGINGQQRVFAPQTSPMCSAV